MRRLSVFNSVSVDGYYRTVDGDLSWAHAGGEDPEFADFTAGNASGDSTLLFGRKTYEMMASFWPTPMAAAQMPVVARQMNLLPKVVFSRTLAQASWQGTTLEKGELVATVRRLKSEGGSDLVIMGSGSIVAPLAAAGLVDELQLLVVPVALGAGRSMFEGLGRPLSLQTRSTRAFGNGKLFITYEVRS